MGLHLVCDDLRALGEEYEKRVSELVGQQPDLAERVEQLEESYDNEVFDTELGELKSWLHRRGIRLD
jgi:chaperonin cofactor prefoldin